MLEPDEVKRRKLCRMVSRTCIFHTNGVRNHYIFLAEVYASFIVLDPWKLQRLPHFEKLTAAAADLDDLKRCWWFCSKTVRNAYIFLTRVYTFFISPDPLKEAGVFFVAEVRHRRGAASGADDIAVVVHGFFVKLHETADFALAEHQRNRMILGKLLTGRNILGGSREILKLPQWVKRAVTDKASMLRDIMDFCLLVQDFSSSIKACTIQ